MIKRVSVLPALLFFAAGSAIADPVLQDNLGWLKVMAFAAHQTDFSGTFVYQYGNHVETSRITHVVDRDGEHGRLEGLDGARREIISNNDQVWCYLGDRKVKLGKRSRGSEFPALLPQQLTLMNENYQIQQNDEGRVAGFHAHAMIFRPRDNLRYARRMWAHADSGLLLKAEILDEQGHVIEQYAFTQLNIGGNIDRKWIESDKSANDVVEDKSAVEQVQKTVSMQPSGWKVSALPAGFKKVTEIRRVLRGKKTPATHMVFSDGLAGISIFIEAADEDEENINTGLSSKGAMHVYSKLSGDNLVTVVGEVPPRTVMQIADSVYYSGK